MDGTLYFNPPVIKRMAVLLVLYYLVQPWKWYQLHQWMRYLHYEKKKDAKGFTPLVYKWVVVRLSKMIAKHKDKTIEEFIKKQRQNGKKIYIYSNVPLMEKIEKLGLENQIDGWFYPDGENITTLKPDSAGLEYIIKTMRLNKSETIYIGDRWSADGRCAEGAGVDYLILPKKKKEREKIKDIFNS
jgi:HAD superfamily hydrolase (TIGR01549 family)